MGGGRGGGSRARAGIRARGNNWRGPNCTYNNQSGSGHRIENPLAALAPVISQCGAGPLGVGVPRVNCPYPTAAAAPCPPRDQRSATSRPRKLLSS
jgi:hypothetical protein